MSIAETLNRPSKPAPTTPNEIAITAMNSALYWARHEIVMAGCEKCDPGEEGSEIWSEIAGELIAGIKALGGVPNDPAPYQKDRGLR